MQHIHFDPVAVVRRDTLRTDATLREIVTAYRKGRADKPAAIVAMREAGACEPEIMEALS